jgi:hypothetical protein
MMMKKNSPWKDPNKELTSISLSKKRSITMGKSNGFQSKSRNLHLSRNPKNNKKKANPQPPKRLYSRT